MLDWERWTLTHSSGGAVVPVLALPLFSGLGLELGLAATWTSSAAAVAGAADVPDVPDTPEGDAVPDAPEGDAVPESDADGEGEVYPEGDGEVVCWALRVGDNPVGGSLAVAVWLAGAEAVWLAGGLVEGEGDGEGERRGEGDGEGVGVADDGSAWHTLFVVAGVAVGAACAVPSTPRVRKLPLSKVTAATLTCAKRIRIACLRCSSGLPCPLS
jgi:hypothetical protein